MVTMRRFDPTTGRKELVLDENSTEEEKTAFVEALGDAVHDAMPLAVEQSNAIAMFLNERGIKPSLSNTIALLMLACANAHHGSNMTEDALTLILGLLWELIEKRELGMVEPPDIKAAPKS